MASIREKGRNQWQVQIRRKGWPRQNATFRTKKQAQAWARKIEAEMDQGIHIDHSIANSITLGDLIKLYLKNVTANRPTKNSRVSETLRLERFLKCEPDLCAYALINLRPEHFEAYRERRLQQKVSRGKSPQTSGKTLSPSTVKRELNLLKRVLDYKRRWHGLHLNPANHDDVKRPSVHDERNVRLTRGERDKLMEECRSAKNTLLAPFVEMGFETGARRGNLLKLEWKDINFSRGTAVLRGIKNSRTPDKVIDHTIGLSPKAIEVLESLPRTDTRVFPMTGTAFRLAFNRARERAGVPHFRFHDTRHERISSLFEAGWSMINVMAQSGHKDPKSVKRYANIKADFLAQELAKL